MALGIIAGALAGGGAAVRDGAMLELKKRKQAALAQIDHELSMIEQDDQQRFTATENQATREYGTQERLAGQDFTAGQNHRDRSLRTRLANQQEAGANYRTQQDDWSLVPTEDGGYIRYNTATGETASAPEGIATGGLLGGAMTDRQQAQVDYLQAQIEANDDQLYGDGSAMLTPEQKSQLELEGSQLRNQLEGALGMGGQRGGSLLDDLASMRGTSEQRPSPEQNSTPTSATASDKLTAAREEDLALRTKQQTAQRVESLTEQANALVETMTPQGRDDGGVLGVSASMTRPGANRTDPRFTNEAQAVAEELMAIHDDPATSDFQKRQIMETLNKLQNLGAQLQ